MSIRKQYLKDGLKCNVTFRIPGDIAGNARQACVVGEFNGWDSTAAPMKKFKNGSFSLTMSLPVGNVYQFRYILDDDGWISETEADGLVYCPFGQCDNSVLNLLRS